jgi:hypothetical protein
VADVLRFNTERLNRRSRSSDEIRERAKQGRIKLRARYTAMVEAVTDGNLIPTDLHVNEWLTGYPSATIKGYCWAAVQTGAEKCGLSHDTISRSTARQALAGFVEVLRRGRGRTNLYTFLLKGEPIWLDCQRTPAAKSQDKAPNDTAHDTAQEHASVRQQEPASVRVHVDHEHASVRPKSGNITYSRNSDPRHQQQPHTRREEDDHDSVGEAWLAVKAVVIEKHGDQDTARYLDHLTVRREAAVVVLIAKGSHYVDRINRDYLTALDAAWRAECSWVRDVRVTMASAARVAIK